MRPLQALCQLLQRTYQLAITPTCIKLKVDEWIFTIIGRFLRLLQTIWVWIKVGRIRLSANIWYDRCRQRSFHQLLKVETIVPFVSFDIECTLLQTSVSFGQISGQQLFYQAFRLAIKESRETNFAGQNLLVNSHWIVVHEWRLPSKHFVGQNAQRPPIDPFPMAFVQQNLGGNVFGSPAQSIRLKRNDLRKPKICQFQVALGIQQQVFWLQIAVNGIALALL